MKAIKLLIRLLLVFCVFYSLNACHTLNKGMSTSEFYDYLREDTVMCELSTFSVESSFESVLGAVIEAWEDCPVCKEDLHPFVFEIEEELFEDTLAYTIRTNASPKMAHQYYLGGFTHKGYVFAVLKKSTSKTSLIRNEQSEPTKIYFCDRIHSTKCDLLIKCSSINDSCSVTSVECQEADIIKIK